jgi:hypothetical protein
MDQTVIQSLDLWITNFQFEKQPNFTPLLVTGPACSGKSSLISSWLSYHRTYHPKANYLVLYENPSLTSTPSSNESLFSLLNRLREEYDLPNRTSILEERLRMGLAKFLDQANSLEGTRNILIIVDGVDLFRESSGKEASAEWLPCNLPERIKVIYSCDLGSEAESVLAQKCKVVRTEPLGKAARKRVLSEIMNKFTDMQKSENLRLVKKFIKENSESSNGLYLRLFITWALSCYPGTASFVIPTVKEIPDVSALFLYAVRFFGPLCRKAVVKVLGCLCLCKYGLTCEEIAISSGVTIKQASKVLSIFEPCLVHFNDFYSFSNSVFRNALINQVPPNLVTEISLTLEEHNPIERINELLHSLSLSANWKHLREKLRDINVFTYLYCRDLKLHLCRYWLELEKNGFDCVEEYTKCIEDLVANNPAFKSEDVVLVLLNFFSFFLEYGEIESVKAREFRNYPLVNKESLQDINLFLEIEKSEDLFEENPVSPLQANERFLIAETKHEVLRDSVEELYKEQKRKLNLTPLSYKRWLWINFPWLVLSPTVNASDYLAMFRGITGSISYQQEKELNEKLFRILTPARPMKSAIKVRPQTTNMSMRRTSGSMMLSTKLGLQTTHLTHADTEIQHLSANNSLTNQNVNYSSFDNSRPQTYNVHFSLRDTAVNTVLLKLDSQLVKFSQVELKKQQKITFKLQQQYNKLIEYQRIKQKEIEDIATQIAQLEAKSREKEETVKKINFLQYQTNKNLEKLVIAQTEGDYLVKIQKSCIANPPFRQEWNNDIISAIETINSFVKYEQTQIEAYKQEMLDYQARMNTLKPLITEKRLVETTTLVKLSEKYSLNAYINKSVVRGFNRRKMILLMPEAKEPIQKSASLKLTSKLPDKRIVFAKNYLENKINYYKSLFDKFIEVSKEKESLDTNGVISKFQEYSDLLQQKKDIERNLNDLKLEKTHLQEQLNYLSIHKPLKVEEEEHLDYHEMSDRLDCTLMKIMNLNEKTTDQELKIIKISEIIRQLFKNMKQANQFELKKEDVRKVFRLLGDKVLEMKNKEKPGGLGLKMQSKIWDAVRDKQLFVRRKSESQLFPSSKPSRRQPAGLL